MKLIQWLSTEPRRSRGCAASPGEWRRYIAGLREASKRRLLEVLDGLAPQSR